MRQAMLVLHPHGQFNRVAMRFTAGLSNSSADWANATPANNATSRKLFITLLLNRRMFLCNSNHLRPGVRQTYFIRDQAHNGAEREHPKSDPDPRDQREDVGLDYGPFIVG